MRKRPRYTALQLEALYEIHKREVSINALAANLGRSFAGLDNAIMKWANCTSRVALAALAEGKWPRGSVPDGLTANELLELVRGPSQVYHKHYRDQFLPDRLTTDKLKLMSQARREGATLAEVAQAVGMSVSGVSAALNGWAERRSRIAQDAIAAGTWTP